MWDIIEKSREKAKRRAESKLMRDSPEGQSSRNSPALEELKGKREKGRPPKNPVEADYEPALSNGKRKRYGKTMSVTPSLGGDDDDRDLVRTFVLTEHD